MAGTISPDVARAAVALRKSHPHAPALEVLDVVMRQRAGCLADFGADQLDPGSPFGQIVAEAFDRAMTPAEWAVVTDSHADPVLVGALRSVWAREVLPRFAANYGLAWRASPSSWSAAGWRFRCSYRTPGMG